MLIASDGYSLRDQQTVVYVIDHTLVEPVSKCF